VHKRSFLLVHLVVTILILSIFLTYAKAEETKYLQEFGHFPQPQNIQKVLSAGPVADVMLLSVSPTKLIGLSSITLSPQQKKYFNPRIQNLPITGRLAGRATTASYEKIIQLQPDLIIDIGNITPTYVDLAKRVELQTHIPYLLIDGSLAYLPKQIRQLSHILNVDERGEQLGSYADTILIKTKNIGNPRTNNQAIKVYSARGPDGLETGLKGSIHTEVLEWVGAQNAAQEAGNNIITRVSLEQLLTWQPDVIIASDANFYHNIKNDPRWNHIKAVKNGQVYLVPSTPFGWLDGPPSVNRLLRLSWLAHILYPDKLTEVEFKDNVISYFQVFYNYQLSANELNQILNQE